ncbi:V-type ATP synthase subunit I, partial [Candidatus Desantisbacteria bacterium]|nr:V-type ATP synthase subunit I [Candidatus Desantisbacteria bacterium]
ELEGCFFFFFVQEEKGEVTCVFLGLKLYKETIDKIFKANSVIPVDFPLAGWEGTVSDAIQDMKLRIQEIERACKELEQKKNSLAAGRTKITLLYDHYYTIKNRLNTHNEFGHTQHTVIIKGWVKEYDTERLTQKLKTISDEIYVTFSDPDPSQEEVPIALKNKFMIKPFELIVRLYGMPSYMEKDPTPLIAVFFSLIFAFALADGIYGIVLAAIAYKILKKRDLDEQDTDVLWMLIWCGMSTLVVGAILGSWCGDIMDRLPSALSGITSAKNSLMLFDPLKDLKIFIAVSLSIGVIHVFTGLGFKAYQNILNGKFQDAFFDQVSWIILVSSVIGWGLAKSKIIPPFLLFSGVHYYHSWGFIFGALLIVLFGARDVKNIFSRVGMGLYKLYGASSYASDILSYIRLLALGLAGGIVGMVINIISGLLLKVPVVGIILAIALFSGFHLFSLAINVLGAFVHTCRLHYVEFFGKFYDNGGKAFIPFRKEGKYYIVKC